MKQNKNNKSLFWYGFFAELKKLFGGILIFIGIFIGIFYNSLIIFVIISIIGIVFILKGHSQRFDYKRQSGYIVHSGD